MIDEKGSLVCKYCGKEILLEVISIYAKWYCPKCHKFQVDDTNALPIKVNLTKVSEYV